MRNLEILRSVCIRANERNKWKYSKGLEAALERKQRERPPRHAVFDAVAQARLVALACSEAPEGRERWTPRLLTDKGVELGWAESVSLMTIRCENEMQPHLKEY